MITKTASTCPFQDCGRKYARFAIHWRSCHANPTLRQWPDINPLQRDAPYHGCPCVGCGQHINAIAATHVIGIHRETVYVYECEACGGRQDDVAQ